MNVMATKTLWLIRHCQATGQAPDAPLTAVGAWQAQRLADQLANHGIECIVSSPWRRARTSVVPLAERLGIPVETDERLVERALSATALLDWRAALRATFDDFDLTFAGGESSRAAQQRGGAALDAILARSERATAVVTHGNLLALLLKRYDERIGFAEWEQLQNPDIYRLTFDPAGVKLMREVLR